jgi:hypothetical protein
VCRCMLTGGILDKEFIERQSYTGLLVLKRSKQPTDKKMEGETISKFSPPECSYDLSYDIAEISRVQKHVLRTSSVLRMSMNNSHHLFGLLPRSALEYIRVKIRTLPLSLEFFIVVVVVMLRIACFCTTAMQGMHHCLVDAKGCSVLPKKCYLPVFVPGDRSME